MAILSKAAVNAIADSAQTNLGDSQAAAIMERVEKAAYQGAYSIDVSESDCGTDCQGQFTAQGYTVTVDTGIVTIDWA